MKFLMSVDMEGLMGVVDNLQRNSDRNDYKFARKLMAEQVNAVIEGILEVDRNAEVWVNDSHNNMMNLLPTDLLPQVYLLSGRNKRYSMMEGIGSSFSGVFYIGYHAKRGTPEAVLDHTYSESCVLDISVNNVSMGEFGINNLLAGWFKVPGLMISGDDKVVKEAKVLCHDIIGVTVKKSFGRYDALYLPIKQVKETLKNGSSEAAKRVADITPFEMESPYDIKIKFTFAEMAELVSNVPTVERIDNSTVSIKGEDYERCFRTLLVCLRLAYSGIAG